MPSRPDEAERPRSPEDKARSARRLETNARAEADFKSVVERLKNATSRYEEAMGRPRG